MITKLKQFSEKLNNWKYSLPLILVGIVSLLFVAEFVEKSSALIGILLLIVFAILNLFLNFTNNLCLLVSLIAFKGIANTIIEPNWFNVALSLFCLVSGIKVLVDFYKGNKKIAWLPLIFSIILIVLGFINFNTENIKFVLIQTVIIALLYISFINSKDIDINKVIKYYLFGLCVSLILSIIFLFIPELKSVVLVSHEKRFQAFTGQPNSLQIFLALALSLIMYLFFKERMNKISLCVLSIIFIIFGVLTKSKAFLLCLIVLSLVLVVFAIIKYRKKGLIFAIGFAMAGLLFLLLFHEQIFQIIGRLDKYNYDNLMDSILTGRWSIWKKYIDIWNNSVWTILFGCGITSNQPIIKGTHSLYINLLYYYGLIGYLIIFGLIITYFLKVKNKRKNFNFVNLIPLGMFMFIAIEETLMGCIWSILMLVCIKILFDSDTTTNVNKGSNIGRLKFLKFKDILSIIPMFIAFIPAMITKIFVRDFWLICEDVNDARDNGYWLFKYIREKQPQQKVAYAINKKSPDYIKVKNLGKVIQYGSLSHWFWYFVADKNISSQKSGKPNAAVCYLLEVVLKLRKNNRVFLQHGIVINDLKFIYYTQSNIRMFTTSTFQEFEFVNNNFGYPKGYVQLIGMPRFDNLNNKNLKKDQILVMPTWRNWISREVECEKVEGTKNFTETEYFKEWSSFLNSEKLHKWLDEHNKTILFYPHRNMQKYIEYFTTTSDRITIASCKDYDVQTLLNESAVLITDYSSVFFDFAYLGKPIIFYQFDEERFRKYQNQEGYFDYHDNELSVWSNRLEDIIKHLNNIIKNKYKKKIVTKKYFKYLDNNNCERNYLAIKEINKRK